MENTRRSISPLVGLGIVLGLALIISAGIGAYTLYQVRAFDNALAVTGSAKKSVTSDTVKWTSSITRSVKLSGLKAGYATLDQDLAQVKTFMKEQGIEDGQIIVTPVFMNEVYQQYPQNEKEYTLQQNIEVQSTDVSKITMVAKNTSALIGKNILFATNGLEYYYSKLPEERVALLAQAIVDAKARATEIAQSSGKKVGSLKSASSGVVQVLSKGSTDVSDYGAYDTSKVEKEIMVTVKASFLLK